MYAQSYDKHLLKNLDIEFETEKTFDWLVSDVGGFYRLDIYIPKLNLTTLWFELGFIQKDSLKNIDYIQLNEQYKNELLNIQLSELSFIEILTFM
jgi:hypothetical protein